MHSSPTTAFDMGARYNAWFSERFGYGVRLLYLGPNRREVLGEMPPNTALRAQRQREAGSPVEGQGKEKKGWLESLLGKSSTEEEVYPGVDEGISFADCAPYLVISTKSWESAQARLPEGEEMDITKFRPNIVVEGAEEEFEEDFWRELEVIAPQPRGGGDQENESEAVGARIILTQNCARCNSLNVDYRTGKVGKGEAGKILAKLQKDRRVDVGSKYSPIFGRYGFLDRLKAGTAGVELRVGDEVRVARRNNERTKWVWPNLGTTN
jgi:uncharacterized protein YcbX